MKRCFELGCPSAFFQPTEHVYWNNFNNWIAKFRSICVLFLIADYWVTDCKVNWSLCGIYFSIGQWDELPDTPPAMYTASITPRVKPKWMVRSSPSVPLLRTFWATEPQPNSCKQEMGREKTISGNSYRHADRKSTLLLWSTYSKLISTAAYSEAQSIMVRGGIPKQLNLSCSIKIFSLN